MSCFPTNRKDTTVDQIVARVQLQSRMQKRSQSISDTDQKTKYFKCICSKEKARLYQTEKERRCQKCAGSKLSTAFLVQNCLGSLRIANAISNRNVPNLFQSLNCGCIRRSLCDGTSRNSKRSKSKKLKRKLSANTLHSADSLVDLRSWCCCDIQRRQYFLEAIVVRFICKIMGHA